VFNGAYKRLDYWTWEGRGTAVHTMPKGGDAAERKADFSYFIYEIAVTQMSYILS
jgi:hypothetical protein